MRDRSFHHGGSWARTISESNHVFCFVFVCVCVSPRVSVSVSVSVSVCVSLCQCLWCVFVFLADGEPCLRREQFQRRLWWSRGDNGGPYVYKCARDAAKIMKPLWNVRGSFNRTSWKVSDVHIVRCPWRKGRKTDGTIW